MKKNYTIYFLVLILLYGIVGKLEAEPPNTSPNVTSGYLEQ